MTLRELKVLVILFCASTASAQECVSVENDLDRLTCYDAKFGRTATTERTSPSTNWFVEVKKSEFKDTTDVYVRTVSLEPIYCKHRKSHKAVLLLRCAEKTTSLHLSTNCHMADLQDYGLVEYRIEKQAASSKRFTESTNNRALGLWNGSEAIPFIKKLVGADTLLVRFTPYNDNKITAKFDISGLEKAIKPLRQNCNW